MCQKSNFKHAPCPTCLGKVSGRRDKRFCSIKCKNEHHRVARLQIKSRFGELHERLRRNLVVLEGIVGQNANKVKIHRNTLFKFGFDFKPQFDSKLQFRFQLKFEREGAFFEG